MIALGSGGPAFPMDDKAVHAVAFDEVKHLQGTAEHEAAYIAARTKLSTGMSLRDYFAGEALAGVPMPQNEMHDGAIVYERIAMHCWKLADAMLRTRDREVL